MFKIACFVLLVFTIYQCLAFLSLKLKKIHSYQEKDKIFQKSLQNTLNKNIANSSQEHLKNHTNIKNIFNSFLKHCKNFNSKHFKKKSDDLILLNFIEFILVYVQTGISIEQATQKAIYKQDLLKSKYHYFLEDLFSFKDNLKKTYSSASNLNEYFTFMTLYQSYCNGSSVEKSLQYLLNKLREQIDLNNKIKSISSQSKMQAGVCMLLPIFFIVIVTVSMPDYFRPVLNSSSFTNLSIFVLFLYVIAIVWIKSICSLKQIKLKKRTKNNYV